MIEDLRVNAPHIKVSVVMPGHIGTNIVANSRRYLGGSDADYFSDEDLESGRKLMAQRGLPVDGLSAAQLREAMKMAEESFRTRAPLDAAGAARIILDGVRTGRWRILVGADAHQLDEQVRADPEAAYDHARVGLATLTIRPEAGTL